MTDAATTTRSTKRIATIVYERPPFSVLRFLGLVILGIVLGCLLGLLFMWLVGMGSDSSAAVGWKGGSVPFVPACIFVGLLTGLAFGWAWKRAVRARIERIDAPPSLRRIRRRSRRARSTDLVPTRD